MVTLAAFLTLMYSEQQRHREEGGWKGAYMKWLRAAIGQYRYVMTMTHSPCGKTMVSQLVTGRQE
jgi:hypothetical protein